MHDGSAALNGGGGVGREQSDVCDVFHDESEVLQSGFGLELGIKLG